jgi:cytochrome c biogenesis protein CcdA
MNRVTACINLLLCLCAPLLHAQSDIPPVVIDYFYEPGCPECLRIKREVLPDLLERYQGFYQLNRHDMGLVSNVVKLVAYQESLGVTKNSPVSMFVDHSRALCGIEAIRSGLFPFLDESIEARMMPDWEPRKPIEWDASRGVDRARQRAGRFTVPAVIAAGLIDGINPCAISTLVFFMSLLIVSGVRGRGLLLMGSSFCFASFATYTAIGFGLLRCLHVLEAFPTVRTVFEVALAAILLLLAVLSFRDAIRFRRSHDPRQVSVQLPEKVKKLIHTFLRKGVKSHHLLVAGLSVGTLVTALETVCTGQVYVPTMTLVIREGGDTRMLVLLLLYNTMFIIPLVVAIILTRYGLTTHTMLKWSKRNVPFSKTILGIFFLAVAIYLLT